MQGLIDRAKADMVAAVISMSALLVATTEDEQKAHSQKIAAKCGLDHLGQAQANVLAIEKTETEWRKI